MYSPNSCNTVQCSCRTGERVYLEELELFKLQKAFQQLSTYRLDTQPNVTSIVLAHSLFGSKGTVIPPDYELHIYIYIHT